MRDITRRVFLHSLADNYRQLSRLATPASCAAVVKANGYGLGMVPVSQALHAAGCNEFFVATLAEGEQLRLALPAPTIFVLNGLGHHPPQRFQQAQLIPVLNSGEEIAIWAEANHSTPSPCSLHVDTGMQRLGLPGDEFTRLLADPQLLQRLNPVLVMSHLINSELSTAATNDEQLKLFNDLLKNLPPEINRSLSNSSGIFLGDPFKFDLCRAGAACYGLNPLPGQANPMLPVVEISAPIIQIREVHESGKVGYGGTGKIAAGGRLATIAAGYADGYPRHAGGNATIQIGEWLAPVVGRVSMDLISVDISHLPRDAVEVGDPAYLLGPLVDADALAKAAGTIGYEILTGLGRLAETDYPE